MKRVILVLWLLALPVLTYRRVSTAWQSDLALWQEAVQASPGKSRVWVHLIIAKLRMGIDPAFDWQKVRETACDPELAKLRQPFTRRPRPIVSTGVNPCVNNSLF